MLLSNSRNLNPMGAFFFRFAPWTVTSLHALTSLLMPAFFYKKKPPTVPPFLTPKLTKRGDSAAVLLIFSDPFVAPEHRCLQMLYITNIACSQYKYVWSLMIRKIINWEILRQWLVLCYFNLFPIIIGQLSSRTFRFWISILQEYNVYVYYQP